VIHRQSVKAKQGYGLLRIKKTVRVNPYFITHSGLDNFTEMEVEIRFSAEMDEFRSFVQNKGNQRWTRDAMERR
jgi:hypothetical protein